MRCCTVRARARSVWAAWRWRRRCAEPEVDSCGLCGRCGENVSHPQDAQELFGGPGGGARWHCHWRDENAARSC
eukprot:5738464-Prymnesium_polylepis.1